MISVREARQKILESAVPLDIFTIPIEKALTYHLAVDIVADRPIPPFNRVLMDGFAVRTSDFVSHRATLQIKGTLQAGVSGNFTVNPRETVKVMTGAPCPYGANAVIKVEQSEINGDQAILTAEKLIPNLNIALKGEDAEAGTVLIGSSSALNAAGIAVCASVGISEVAVYKKPVVSIVTTGTEIIPADRSPLDHQIRDCNSFALRAMCDELRITSRFLGIGEDTSSAIEELIRKGLESDILVLTGGVSMGDFDFVPSVLSELGVTKIFHKINMKPGKPLWFGKTCAGKYVFGLPGNPVSAQACFKLFAVPLIKKLSGNKSFEPETVFLPLSQEALSKTSREHFIPARLQTKENRTYLEPVIIRSSGDFYHLEKSHGLIRCPAEIHLLKKNTLVEFLPWKEIW